MMKLALALSAVITLAITVGASNMNAAYDPAIVIKEGACFLPGIAENGSSDPALGSITTFLRTIENRNKVTLHCHAEVINLSGRGHSQRNLACLVLVPSGGSITTEDTRLTVSASGQAEFRCEYRKD